MKLKEATQIIKDGWVRRRKGFRVRFGALWLAGRSRIEVTGTGLLLILPLNRYPAGATISCTC